MLIALDAYAQYGNSVSGDLTILRYNLSVCVSDFYAIKRRGEDVTRYHPWRYAPTITTREQLIEFCTVKVLAMYRTSLALNDRLLQGIIDSAGSGVKQAPAPVYPGERRRYENVEDRKMIEQFSAGLSAAGQAAVRQHYAEQK
jgi:hypothetical protein